MHVEMGRQLDGGARQLSLLLNGVDKLPGDHSLVCPSGAEIIGSIEGSSVKIHRLKAKEEKGRKLTSGLRKLLRRERPDLLHIHSRPGDAAAIWAGHWEKRQMVYTRRNDTHPGLIERYIKLKKFIKIVTPSQSIRRALAEVGVPSERLVSIPCAVDGERFKPGRPDHERFQADFGLRGDGPVLAMVANWVPNKGHGVLFGALQAIVAKHPTVRVLIFGRGPAKDEMQREVKRRELDNYVRFEGFRPDLENILPHVDMLIHPSFEDAMAVALLEAAASGVPIVASRIGGIPDIVRDRFNGYLVKPGDSINLARHIVALLDDRDQLLQFGRTGREMMLENFNVDRLLAGYRDIYRFI
jgi:glycosyltransferase involved in cell wall biosynthesis